MCLRWQVGITLCKNVVHTFILQNEEHTLNHESYDAVFPKGKIHGSGNKGLQREGTRLIITTSDPLKKLVLPIPTILGPVGF